MQTSTDVQFTDGLLLATSRQFTAADCSTAQGVHVKVKNEEWVHTKLEQAYCATPSAVT